MARLPPVAIIFFNRPETLARVLAAVRAMRPDRLYLIADGPREDHPSDSALCTAARAVADAIDWPCTVRHNYADTNLGCRRRIVSGLDWLFAQEEEAVIFEDDCLPAPSFLPYCAELLERYRDEARIATIGGHVMQGPSVVPGPSYRFSRYPSLWGWACWRRSWRRYDDSLADWPALAESGWPERQFTAPGAAQYWRLVFNQVRAGGNAWDYALTFACFRDGALSIHPAVNMVANIGFGAGATHDARPDHPAERRRARDIAFPLLHPAAIEANDAADALIEEWVHSGSWPQRFAYLRARLAAKRGDTITPPAALSRP
ncbi:MAG: hypothetical protein KIT16_18980 [Rhodospirillaceae bacterium]|nr:hypothetical protein [Rhodospirillaceae bacterium]